MPFAISGNLDKIDSRVLIDFQRRFGVILSQKQFLKQQQSMIQTALKSKMNFVDTFSKFSNSEVISFVFLITQFADSNLDETPYEYSYFHNNPYILEWQKNSFTIPFEILDYLAGEKIFKDQNYLFSILTQMNQKEKKSWLKWLGVFPEGESEKEMNHGIYNSCRILQKPFLGKSFIEENEFQLEKLWPRGTNKFIDWFYKGISTFYFALQELSRTEQDPFFQRVIQEIKSGKLILKKNNLIYGEPNSYKLIATIEGKSLQLRKNNYFWEEKSLQSDSLFNEL